VAGFTIGFTDQSLLALDQHMGLKLGEARMASLDRNLPTVDYTRHRPGAGTGGPDKIRQSYELFAALTADPELKGIYQRFAAEPLPWMASATPFNQALLGRFDAVVREWREDHSSEDQHSAKLAKAIMEWVLTPAPDGMGMKAELLGPEWNFDRAVQEGKGNCTELTFILLNLYERAGYQVHPEWVGVDMNGDSVVHVTAAVEIQGRRYLADAVYNSGTFDAPHQAHTPLTKTQLLGYYWHNRALYEDQHGDKKLALQFYQLAEQVDPYNPFIPFNRGLFYSKDKGLSEPERTQRAEAEFHRALKIDPDFPSALVELGVLADRRGDFRQALVFLRKSLKGDPRDLKARLLLIQALGGLKRLAEAERELRALQKTLPASATFEQRAPVERIAAWLEHEGQSTKSAQK
jgi:cytochrome c-type biogenesis protein CcmH/NrfG